MDKPRKISGWPVKLSAFIESRRGTPFKWGENDCCLFACDAIAVLTGIDPAAKSFRGKYTTALGAGRLLKKSGGVEGVAAKQCQKHGFDEVPVAFAQRGDVVLIDLPGIGDTLGICTGVSSVFPGEEGLVENPTLLCRKAWRIG